MNLKKLLNWFLVVVITAVLTMTVTTRCSNNNPRNNYKIQGKEEKTQLVLKLGHTHPDSENSALHSTAVYFQQALEKYRINLQIFHSGQLGDNRELNEQLRRGTIDFVVTGTGVLTTLAPKLGVLDLPYVWKNYDHIHKVLDGVVGEEMSKSLLPANIRTLCWTDTFGFRNVGTVNDTFTNIEEVRRLNLKIRTIESETYINAIRSMGMNPIPMGYREIYTAMQTEMIDGYEHDASSTYSNKFYEVAKNYMLTEHMYSPLCIFVSELTWEKLDEEHKKAISKAAIEAGIKTRQKADKKNIQMIEKLKENGMNIVEVDKTGFIEACKPFNIKFSKEHGASEILKIIMDTE